MLNLVYEKRFKKDFKLIKKRGYQIAKLEEVISLLSSEKALPAKFKDHALTNSKNYNDVRECHIQPDWLLVYQINHDQLILRLMRTGTHSDLF